MNISHQNNRHKRVAVALSGGVDSAVAAALLLEQGYDVTAFYMKNWTDIGVAEYRKNESCPWLQDYEDAQAVSKYLGIPCEIVHFEKEYRERVLEYFLNEYKHNRTPNPDVMCNTEIKFRAFYEHALKLGFDYVATGHYARIVETQNVVSLLRGTDPNKDQSYFIHHLTEQQLAKIIFPIGHLLKPQVRELAKKFNLPVASKPDSQGLCFVGDIDFRTFLKHYIKAEPGPMVLTNGTVMGEHTGLAYYTLGQRSGINIGGTGPYYVVDKRVKDNTLVICRGKNDPSLFSSAFMIGDMHWISASLKLRSNPFNCTVKVRYRSPDVPCRMEGNRVILDRPERAITPGQFAVFYDGDVVLGGAVINSY